MERLGSLDPDSMVATQEPAPPDLSGLVKSVDGKAPDPQGDVALGAMSADFVTLTPTASGGTFNLERGKRYTMSIPFVINSGAIFDIVFPPTDPEIIDFFIEIPAGVNASGTLRFNVPNLLGVPTPKATIDITPGGSWLHWYTYFRLKNYGRLMRRLIPGSPSTTFASYAMESVIFII